MTKRPLREHQLELIQAVTKALRKGPRALAVSPCGTGKTMAGLGLWERLRATRSVILVPSLQLVAQTHKEWSLNSEQPFRSLVVCSESERDIRTRTKRDEAETNLSHLEVTSSSDRIREFLRTRDRAVVFSTYQSAPLMQGQKLDLGIFDEAHRTAGEGELFGFALHDQNIRIHKRLFMTATPRIYEGDGDQEQVRSMNDPELYGPEAYTMTFGEAIAKGLLTDYQIIVLTGVEENPDREHRLQVTCEMLRRARKEFGIQRTFLFTSSVKRAQEAAGLLGRDAWWVSGAQKTKEREASLEAWKQRGGVIANVRCLAEGVDVPNADSVVFLDPKRSTTDLLQAMGRATRLCEGKAIATIVIPALTHSGDPESLQGEFGPTGRVLKAFRSMDARIEEVLMKAAAQAEGTGAEEQEEGSEPKGPRIIWSGGKKLDPAFFAKMKLRVLRAGMPDLSWRQRLEELARYYEKHGRFPPFSKPGLGKWIQGIKYNIFYRDIKANIIKNKEPKLEPIRRYLSLNTRNEYSSLFDNKIEALLYHHTSFGCFPSNGTALGNWLQHIRSSPSMQNVRERVLALKGAKYHALRNHILAAPKRRGFLSNMLLVFEFLVENQRLPNQKGEGCIPPSVIGNLQICVENKSSAHKMALQMLSCFQHTKTQGIVLGSWRQPKITKRTLTEGLRHRLRMLKSSPQNYTLVGKEVLQFGRDLEANGHKNPFDAEWCRRAGVDPKTGERLLDQEKLAQLRRMIEELQDGEESEDEEQTASPRRSTSRPEPAKARAARRPRRGRKD